MQTSSLKYAELTRTAGRLVDFIDLLGYEPDAVSPPTVSATLELDEQ